MNKSKCKDEVRKRLEEDAKKRPWIHGLKWPSRKPEKMEFLLINEKKVNNEPELTEIVVGESTIKRTDHTKLLGIQIQESQEWTEHLKCLTSSLNQRLFVIQRVAPQTPKSKLMNIVHSLWVSKLRYGLQLCTKVQINQEERRPALMKSLQLTQNRLLRTLNGTKISDKISTQSMLSTFQLLSVNHLAAEIKLIETWKSINLEYNPIQLEPFKANKNAHQLRPQLNRIFKDDARLAISQSSFHIDAARVWNNAPPEIKNAITLADAKKNIKIYSKSLPI